MHGTTQNNLLIFQLISKLQVYQQISDPLFINMVKQYIILQTAMVVVSLGGIYYIRYDLLI